MIVIISDGGGRLQFKNTRLGLSLRSGTLAMQVNDHDYNDQNGGDYDDHDDFNDQNGDDYGGRGDNSNDH